MDTNMKDGIERFIKYIRRMSILSDDQLRTVISIAIAKNPDSIALGTDIDKHIAYIRSMSALTDDQIIHAFKDSANDPNMKDVFEDAAKKKILLDMKTMAKDIRGNPKKFARRVDEL